MAFGVLGAVEHVASAGNVGNCLIVLAADLAQGTNGCFGFAMETCPSQPLVGLWKVYLWDAFLLGKELIMHGLCKEGIIMGVVCHGGGK
eukprot:2687006-Ditylum_brightwellii.AAC.1